MNNLPASVGAYFFVLAPRLRGDDDGGGVASDAKCRGGGANQALGEPAIWAHDGYKCSARVDAMLEKLPPRERQIVDILYADGAKTVAEVCEALPDALSASAVRAMLTRLEAKGYVQRSQSEKGYVFAPAVPESKAKQSALSQLVRTFFGGSAVGAATALLGMSAKLDDAELAELERTIAAARKARQGDK